MRPVMLLLALLGFGAVKLPVEQAIDRAKAELHLRSVVVNFDIREQIGQLGFVAALSGLRAVVADLLFIDAHVAWERTDWPRVLLLFRQVTTLQPHEILFWDMAAWHMAWNAGAAALNDRSEPLLALRVKKQREYLALGKEFLERGIRNNPDRPQLYEALARLYRDKYADHEHAAEYFGKAAGLPGAASYDRRFAAYELSYCAGRQREAYQLLRSLYDSGERERLPTLIKRLKFLEQQLVIPADQRIPDVVR